MQCTSHLQLRKLEDEQAQLVNFENCNLSFLISLFHKIEHVSHGVDACLKRRKTYQHFPALGPIWLGRGCPVVGQSSILSEAKRPRPHWRRSRRRMDRWRCWCRCSVMSRRSSGASEECLFSSRKQRCQILEGGYEEVAIVRYWQVAGCWDSFEGKTRGVHLLRRCGQPISLVKEFFCRPIFVCYSTFSI